MVSGLGAKTLKVAQLSSRFSILNTVLVLVVPFNVYGNDQSSLLEQLYKVIGLVFKHIPLGVGPKNGFVHPAGQSQSSPFCCYLRINSKVLTKEQEHSLLFPHISYPPFL